MHRVMAGLVAAIAWVGLAVQFFATFSANGDLLATLWILARFFTVLTNLLVAVTMTAIAVGRRVSPAAQGGVALAIMLVGVVYALLLSGLQQLTGAAQVANIILHYVVPAATAIYWLGFAPKIGLNFRHPFVWSLYPLLYFVYALPRGSIEGRYPYPFMDLGELGLARVLLNALGIAIAFIVGGFIMVALGRVMARRRGARGPLGQQPSNG